MLLQDLLDTGVFSHRDAKAIDRGDSTEEDSEGPPSALRQHQSGPLAHSTGNLIKRALHRLGLTPAVVADPHRARNIPVLFLVATLAEEVETFPPGGQNIQVCFFPYLSLPPRTAVHMYYIPCM